MAQQRTRDRVLNAGMRLFADKGYAGTSVAEIEAAAGLSPGSGSLYRHFPSKRALLEAGVQSRIDEGRQLLARLSGSPGNAPGDLHAEASVIVQAALRRLDASADLNRLILKDLHQFPELMDRVKVDELAPIYSAVAAWITAHSTPTEDEQVTNTARQPNRPGTPAGEADAVALATVLVGATSHFWLLRDGFDQHPAGVSEERFVAAMTTIAEALIAGLQRSPTRPPTTVG